MNGKFNLKAVHISDPAQCGPFEGKQRMDQSLEPGEYFIAECPAGRFYLHFGCPCGAGHRTAIPLKQKLEPGDIHKNVWWWNGSRDNITVNPSLNLIYEPCKWHGFLENGEWRDA